MNEYTPTPATPAGESFTIDLTPSYDDLKNQLAFAASAIESWAKRFNGIKSALEEFVEEGVIEEGGALSDYLIEEFDLETTKEVEVQITITCSATMTIPKNDDVEDYVDYLDIDVDISTSKGEISWVSQDDASISEA